MTEFQHPQFLTLRPWLLALAGLHALLYLQQWWWQRRQFQALALARFGPALSLPRGLLKLGLWAAGGWFLLTALAVPLGPPTKVESQQSGADVILAVDVSSSMLAQDIQPDRLTALKQSLQVLLSRLEGDRVGLVAFAGEAVIACPLTSDFDTVSLFLDKLDVDSVPRDGTGLGPALQLALDAFNTDPSRGKLLLLATDGEDTAASKAMVQAERAKELGIPIFTLGIGTPGGALIPGRRDVFGRVYAKTYQGQPVRTKLDSATLKRIAQVTGGSYSEAGDHAGLARAAERVRALKQGLAQAQDRWVREPLYETPLLWAFALLLLESLFSARAGGWKRWGPALGKAFRRWWHPKAKPVALLLLLAPLPLSAGPRQDYNEGNAAYRSGDFQGAAGAYERALGAGSEKDQAAALYNLGNARFQMQDYDAAISAYEESLRLRPKDEDAQHNLGLARSRKEQQSQGQQGQQGDQKGGKKGDQKGGQPQSGQGQGGQKGPGQAQGATGQGGQGGQPQPGGAASALNQDRVQAMMNQLRLDQKRYSGAFNPMKKYERPDTQPQDPMQQMLEEMGMRPRTPKKEQQGGGPEAKDW